MTKETIGTEKVNENTEIELYLENDVFYLLVRSLVEGDEEIEPMAAGDNQEIAEKIFRFAIATGILARTEVLIGLINSKIFKEVHGLPGITVLTMDELTD